MIKIKISTKGRYGLRVMIDLALMQKDGFVALHDIAKREALSEKYLEQIMSLLFKAGLVESLRGARGGYKTSRDPSQITVLDILLATEKTLAPTPCAENSKVCEGYDDCVTSFIFAKIYEATLSVCKNILLSDLAKKSESTKCNTKLECVK